MILRYFLVTPIAFYFFYCVFPTLFFRLFRKPVFKNRNSKKQILLTFDDGPDIKYTGKLLKILEDNHVQAVFFVIAQKAAQSPELIMRIQEAGHVIALHSFSHKNPWSKSYRYMKHDFEKSVEILKKLGCDVHYYRPPWGIFNLSTVYLAPKYHLKPMLWTVMVQDWEKNSTCERVLSRLRKRVKNGSVICLHDSGEGTGGADGVTIEMIRALKRFIPGMLQNGYRFILPYEDMAYNER